MINTFDNVLNYLKDLSESKSFKILIPSLQVEATFKQLNTEQLKLILGTITDTSSIVNRFQIILYNIVKENLIEKNIDIDQLTTYDFYYIALQIRINCLSENYTVLFTENEIEIYQLPILEYVANLREVLSQKQIKNILGETFIENDISVLCAPTTIKNEIEFVSFFDNNLKALANSDMQKVIGEIFIYEITKSIKQITLNHEVIDFYTLTFEQKIALVKQLPVTLTSKIIRYIENYKQTLYDLYLIQIETINDNNTVIFQKELQYNATLFNY
jgi:hypothetical protein